MAFSHGTAARMFVDGFAAACNVNDFSSSGDIDTPETTTLCNTAKTYIPGLEDATVSMSGYLDTDAAFPLTTFAYHLEARKRTIFPMTYLPNAGATGTGIQGERAYLFNGQLTSLNIGTTVDEAATLELEFQNNTGIEFGITLQPLLTVTADGNGTSLDNGAATSNGANAVLSVSAVSGTTPALDVIIEHSPDDSVWAPLITFTADQNTVNGEYMSATGNVDRYVRARWVVTGTTPEFDFHVAFKRL